MELSMYQERQRIKTSLFILAGCVNAEDLKTQYTEVSVQAAGEARVRAEDKIDVRIRAGGNVYIYGNPKSVDESRVFGGRIKRMN